MDRRGFLTKGVPAAAATVAAVKGSHAKGGMTPGDPGSASARSAYNTENAAPMLFGTNRRTAAGLEPYVPDAEIPWNERTVAHLLRRTTFLPTWVDIKAGLTMQPGELVDTLLEDAPLPPSPGQWIDAIYEKPVTDDEERAYENRNRNNMNELRGWWADLMAQSGLNLTEKMVLFWSGHITSESREVEIPQFMYRQNLLFRNHVFGDFRQLIKETNYDAAMLRYLGGDINERREPNENYARELMELYTMGEGHYTEQDIKEAARALTGWRLDEFSSYDPFFNPLYHDTGNKTFMGQTIVGQDSLAGRFEGDQVVDIIFQREEVATFMCRKFYRYFVYSDPFAVDGEIVNGLAEVFRQNDYRIRPVLQTLLKSRHFFDKVNQGAMIKSPAVLIAGLARQLSNQSMPEGLAERMEELEQELMNPPTVQGWEDYRTWISTTTFPRRVAMANEFIYGGSGIPATDVRAWAKTIDDHNDAEKLIDNILTMLIPKPVSSSRRAQYLNTMLGGAPVYDWDVDAAAAESGLRAALQQIFEAPDFELY
ncbi:MAG: hypothetical protein CL946_06385 [Ectothiorhodospiraceae bacterium]|nr:hypothetical protein [Ectothiorhodospiraceae bacterium]